MQKTMKTTTLLGMLWGPKPAVPANNWQVSGRPQPPVICALLVRQSLWLSRFERSWGLCRPGVKGSGLQG